MRVHHQTVEGEERPLRMSVIGFGLVRLVTYHKVRCVCLECMNGLQLVESRLSPGKTKPRGFLHETQLGVDILQFLVVAQSVPTVAS